MNSLIPVTEAVLGGASQLTVDGRALHAALEVRTKYTDWMSGRLADGQFAEGIDFVHTSEISETCTGAVRRTGHTLAIDTAKHIAMMERNEIGRLARCYFIECERKYKLAAANRPFIDLPAIEAENKARLARLLEGLAATGLYTPVRAALFKAEAASVLAGKPITEYLPPVAGERDKWLTPTQLAERLGTTPNKVGRILKVSGLHGEQDIGHRHSEPFWNITSYKYYPEVVMPALKRHLGAPKANITLLS